MSVCAFIVSPQCALLIRNASAIRMNKRALRAKLGFKTDAPLAKVLGIEPEVLEAWAEEGSVPDSLVDAVLKLLGHGAELDDAPRRPADPDADRIVPVEAA